MMNVTVATASLIAGSDVNWAKLLREGPSFAWRKLLKARTRAAGPTAFVLFERLGVEGWRRSEHAAFLRYASANGRHPDWARRFFWVQGFFIEDYNRPARSVLAQMVRGSLRFER